MTQVKVLILGLDGCGKSALIRYGIMQTHTLLPNVTVQTQILAHWRAQCGISTTDSRV